MVNRVAGSLGCRVERKEPGPALWKHQKGRRGAQGIILSEIRASSPRGPGGLPCQECRHYPSGRRCYSALAFALLTNFLMCSMRGEMQEMLILVAASDGFTLYSSAAAISQKARL